MLQVEAIVINLLFMAAGLVMLFAASGHVKYIIRFVDGNDALRGWHRGGKIYHFFEFDRVRRIYIDNTGDHKRVNAMYVFAILGAILFVGSGSGLLDALGLTK